MKLVKRTLISSLGVQTGWNDLCNLSSQKVKEKMFKVFHYCSVFFNATLKPVNKTHKRKYDSLSDRKLNFRSGFCSICRESSCTWQKFRSMTSPPGNDSSAHGSDWSTIETSPHSHSRKDNLNIPETSILCSQNKTTVRLLAFVSSMFTQF